MKKQESDVKDPNICFVLQMETVFSFDVYSNEFGCKNRLTRKPLWVSFLAWLMVSLRYEKLSTVLNFKVPCLEQKKNNTKMV